VAIAAAARSSFDQDAPLSSADRERVLFVHSATLPPLGADTWVHALLIRHLDRRLVDVHAACAFEHRGARTPTFEALSAVPDLTLRSVNLGPELFRQSLPGKVRGLVETLPAVPSLADLVGYVRRTGIRILHTSDRPRDAAACALVARLTGAKYAVHVHMHYADWWSPMLRRATAGADAVIAVSDHVRGTLLEAGFSPSKTHTVLNSIDVRAWDPSTEGRAVREELSIPPSAPIVTCIARVFREKGQQDLLSALAMLRRDVPDARLLIVGRDYPAGTHHSDDLRRMARGLGILDAVHFLGQRRDIPAILAATDVYAMPSYTEPFGLVYAEAMAMKRPVVALDEGGAPEVVEHEKSGFLCARGDIAALAGRIQQLLENPGLRARMGEYGRRAVETRFAPERMARDVTRIYSSL
jgi:glycosyltransferase involved in cell wall biosynthesis